WLFTRRPWPNAETFPRGREELYSHAWQEAGSVREITTRWLAEHGIEYDRLTVEDDSDSKEARFRDVAERRVQNFVEDDLANALRLASGCQHVFLVDQPYNRMKDPALPLNVVRVRAWQEVVERL